MTSSKATSTKPRRAVSRALISILPLAVCATACALDADEPEQRDPETASVSEAVGGASDALGYPYDSVGRMFSVDQDGKNRTCTGVLITPAFFATAAHCFYGNQSSCEVFAEQQKLVPLSAQFSFGVDPGTAPFAQYTFGTGKLFSATTEQINLCSGSSIGRDIALVRLDRAIFNVDPIHPNLDGRECPSEFGDGILVGYGTRSTIPELAPDLASPKRPVRESI